MEKCVLINRIDEILAMQVDDADKSNLVAGNVYMGALGVASVIYGPNSLQVEAIKEAKKRIMELKAYEHQRNSALVQEIQGMLQCIKNEVNGDFLRPLVAEAKAEVFADFVVLAKEAIQNGGKEVAAVLACAALEDALKRYAELQQLDVAEKSMDAVVSTLRAAGLVKGPQGRLMQSFVPIRNKTFHAQWDKIDKPEIQSVIAFVEEFLVGTFPGPQPIGITR